MRSFTIKDKRKHYAEVKVFKMNDTNNGEGSYVFPITYNY